MSCILFLLLMKSISSQIPCTCCIYKIKSYPIVVSSNPVHGKVYSIQHYVIKFVSDLRPVGGFHRCTPVSSTTKTDRHDIIEILLKVALKK